MNHNTYRDTVVFEAEVTHEPKRGQSPTLPYVDVPTVGVYNCISDYRIYIDLSPMVAAVRGGLGIYPHLSSHNPFVACQ